MKSLGENPTENELQGIINTVDVESEFESFPRLVI